jgi:hypothetical protein
MYVCVYVCMHACMHACMHECMNVHIISYDTWQRSETEAYI